jgi:hypothetical protein
VKAAALLDAHCRETGFGRALTGEAGGIVARKPDTVRGADVAVISYARLPGGPRTASLRAYPREGAVSVLHAAHEASAAPAVPGLRLPVARVFED